MNPEILNELKNRTENNALQDETDVLLFIQIASRLKALGDSSEYDKIEEITQRPEFAGRLNDMLLQRAKQGIWDINAQLGEELGFTIIECQDFVLYYEYEKEKSSFPQALTPWFETWMNAANETEIDEETREVLVRYLFTYPIPEELQIGVVAAPVTQEMYDMLATLGEKIPVSEINSVWQRPEVLHLEFEPSTEWTQSFAYQIACDDGEIPEYLLQRHDRISCSTQTPDGTLYVTQILYSNHQLVFEIRAEDGSVPSIDSVRAEMIPAFTDEEHYAQGQWWINLDDYDTRFWKQILEAPITITRRGRFVWKIQMFKTE